MVLLVIKLPYMKRWKDFTDVIKALTVSKSKERLSWVGLAKSGEPLKRMSKG